MGHAVETQLSTDQNELWSGIFWFDNVIIYITTGSNIVLDKICYINNQLILSLQVKNESRLNMTYPKNENYEEEWELSK
jgi:hypothetical protein